jgi:hypothetical protein
MARIFSIIIISLFFLSGCGYQFKEYTSNLPSNIKSMAIPIFENQTNELGFEDILTAEVIAEFNRRQVLRVKTAGQADAVLVGKINSIIYSPVSYGSNYLSSERRVLISLNLFIREASTGKILWKRDGLSFFQAYAVNQLDPELTDYLKRDALVKISQNLAEKIHDYIFSNF